MTVKKNNRELLRLDPRTIFLLMIISMAVYFQQLPQACLYSVIALGWIFLLLAGHIKTTIKFLLFIAIFLLISFALQYAPKSLSLLWAILTISIQFVLPIISYMVLMVKTNSVNNIAVVLDKLKAPQVISIPVLVMLRFIPTIREEYRCIRNAMVFRGISIGVKNILRHPIKTMEYIYVPLLFSLVRIGEELTMSSLTRGLGLYKTRTVMHDMRLKLGDYLILILYVGIYFGGRYYGSMQ